MVQHPGQHSDMDPPRVGGTTAAMPPPVQHLINWLVDVDRRSGYLLRRALGVLLITLFIGSLCLMLYLWFKLMQPYPE